MPSIQKFGIDFLWNDTWDPVREEYGALVPIFGTVVTATRQDVRVGGVGHRHQDEVVVAAEQVDPGGQRVERVVGAVGAQQDGRGHRATVATGADGATATTASGPGRRGGPTGAAQSDRPAITREAMAAASWAWSASFWSA